MKILTLAAASFALLAAFGEKPPFTRYQSVVDRMPFGRPPENFDPFAPPDVNARNTAAEREKLTPDQEQLQKNVSFNVLNVEPDGTVMVGFVDGSDAKAPRHYYLAVGETRDGWTVRESDPEAKTMTLVKDGVEVTLDLGARSQGKPKAVAPARAAAANARPSMLNRARPLAASAENDEAPRSLRSRRAARLAEERALAAAREQERAKADEEREREAEERAAREQERAEQREQLQKIQEELKRQREERAARERQTAEEAHDSDNT